MFNGLIGKKIFLGKILLDVLTNQLIQEFMSLLGIGALKNQIHHGRLQRSRLHNQISFKLRR